MLLIVPVVEMKAAPQAMEREEDQKIIIKILGYAACSSWFDGGVVKPDAVACLFT
jgi:hypothetical protein